MSIKVKAPKFKKTRRYLDKSAKLDPLRILHRHGAMGVSALSAATPQDSGESANAWSYKIEGNKQRYVLSWTNSAIAGSVPIVILIQYGHATRDGYFLSGRDFINPAIRPIKKSLQKALEREVFA